MANFIIKPLHKEEFEKLFLFSDDELKKMGAVRMTANTKPGFPCRVSLEDAPVGEEVLLLTYPYHKTESPYRAIGPIFVRRHAATAQLAVNQIPVMLHHRLLSVRHYNSNGMMVGTAVLEGSNLSAYLSEALDNPDVAYIQVHNAKAGCYNCMVERA